MPNEIMIQLNGKPKGILEGSNLIDLLELLELKTGQIAIEVNREIVKKDNWKDVQLQDNDVVEIVHFVGGGAPKWKTMY